MEEQEHNVYAAPKSAPLAAEPENVELAERGTRFAAAMIDGLISMAIMFPAMYLTGTWGRIASLSVSVTELVLLAIAGLVLFLLLHGKLLKDHGQTIGKRLVGIRIVSADSGEIIPLQKVMLARVLPVQIVANLPPPFSYLTLVDALMIFRKDRRCLHDMLAGTKVVVVKKS